MSTTIDQTPSQGVGVQELAPAVWEPKEKAPGLVAKEALAKWLKNIAEDEEMFKKHVYENDQLHEVDLRQHRSRLHMLIGIGEGLAADFLVLRQDSRPLQVALIDEQIGRLQETLHAWHGSLEEQDDVPESFKQASREVQAGETTTFDPALLSENA